MSDRLFSAWRAARLFAVGTLLGAAACQVPDKPVDMGMAVDSAVPPPPADLADPRQDAGIDLGVPLDLSVAPDLSMAADLSVAADLSTPPDLTGVMWGDMRPIDTCNMRTPGVTAIQALLRIDSYGGLQTGHSGVHELAEGTLVYTAWVFDGTLVDTSNIHLAMNVASDTDPSGLPMELPLTPGSVIELEGEYIPKASAGYTNAKGPAAVIHFTHAPCGYVIIGGTTYHLK